MKVSKLFSVFTASLFLISFFPRSSFALYTPCGYENINNKIFYCQKQIIDVDIPTFHVFAENPDWAKDKNNVYYEEQTLQGSDPQSFQFLTSPDGFSYGWAKDKNQVYYNSEILENADPSSFSLVNYFYGKDNHAVYFEGWKLQNSDPATFEIMDLPNGDNAKDKNNIYYQSKTVQNADRDTYQLLDFGYSKDKNTVYFRGDEIKHSDSATFKTRPLNDYQSYCGGAAVDAMDKNNFYETGFIVCSAT